MSDSKVPDLKEVLQTAQNVQREVQRIQQELGNKIVEGSAGGGMVTARVNGHHQIVSISIERDIVDPADVEILQDLIVAAVNQGMAKASELAQEELSKATGGLPLKIPGMV